MTTTIEDRFLVRGGTAAAIAALNEVPLARELVIETDTGMGKEGDGVTHYNSLPYTLIGKVDFSGVAAGYVLTRNPANNGWIISAPTGGGGTTVTSDDFSQQTQMEYLQLAQGTNAGWVMAAGVLTPSNGSQATYMRNGFYTADGFVQATLKQAQDGGVVFRLRDFQNFYVCTISDASGTNANKLNLYKCIAGAFTLLGTATIAFTRGTSHTLRLAMSGSAIAVTFDGASKITATDTAITAAGGIGVRSNGAGSQIYTGLLWST